MVYPASDVDVPPDRRPSTGLLSNQAEGPRAGPTPEGGLCECACAPPSLELLRGLFAINLEVESRKVTPVRAQVAAAAS